MRQARFETPADHDFACSPTNNQAVPTPRPYSLGSAEVAADAVGDYSLGRAAAGGWNAPMRQTHLKTLIGHEFAGSKQNQPRLASRR